MFIATRSLNFSRRLESQPLPPLRGDVLEPEHQFAAATPKLRETSKS
jgi:hypothetical protein